MRLKKNHTISIKRGLFYIINFVMILTIISLFAIGYQSEYRKLKKKIVNVEEKNREEQESYLKSNLLSFISDLEIIDRKLKHLPIDSLQSIILHLAKDRKLKHGGYFFINQYNGIPLLFDGKIISDKKNISNLTDPTGKRLFDIEKDAYNSKEGMFMEYLFKPLNADIPELKLSYMRGYHEWKWIVGAGIYLSKPEEEIKLLKQSFKEESRETMLWVMLSLLIIGSIAYLIISHLSKRLVWQVELLKNHFKTVINTNKYVDTPKFEYKELVEIAESFRIMMNESRRLSDTIQEKEGRIKSIYDAASNIAFIITNYNGEQTLIKDFSPGAETIFGYNSQEITGEKVNRLFEEKDFTKIWKIQHLLDKGMKGYSGELYLTRKNGNKFRALITVHPLYNQDKLTGTISVTIDINKRKQAEDELRQLKENLEIKVSERTKELTGKNKELLIKNQLLEKYHDLFVSREFRIKELRDKLKDMEEKN